MKRHILLLIFIFAISNSVFANVQSNIDNGLNWLMTNQNADGSYGNQSDLIFRDTEEVLNTFNILNQKGIQYQSGIQWSTNTTVNSIDFIARKILLLSGESIDTTTGVNILLSNQNTDGGWGIASKFESDSIDTSLALQALKAVNYSDQTVIQSAINYLLSTQNPDGGWGFYQGDESSVYMTTIVSMTIEQFSRTTSIATAINKAIAFLVAHQNTDGGFGSSPSTVYETALSYLALVNEITDATVLGNAINYLTSTQSPDGSWLQDPYSTALALRALYLSENKPAPPPPPTTGTITGRVVDSSANQPLSGVSVILQSDPAINTVTDATGSFTLSAVLQGSQQISLSLPGYATSTVTVTLTAGSITNLGTISLLLIQTTGMVKGTVTDASNGLPLSGVAIGITGSFTGNTVTGTDGSFTFTNVTLGAVTITAAKSGYYSATGAGIVVAGKILFFNPQVSTQPPAATTGNLTGKVFDILNNPIQGATISVSGGSSGGTDSQGVFLIQGLTPGTYQVFVSAPGYISQTYQVMILAGATNDMQIIYLTPSSSVTTITGKVTDASTGAPVANADVSISGTTLSAKTDSAGVYTISGISLLEFVLKASARGYDSLEYAVQTSGYGVYSIDFSLNPSQTSNVRLTTITTENTASSLIKIVMKVVNNGIADIKGNIFLEVIDPKGSVIYSDIVLNLKDVNGDIVPSTFDFLRGEIIAETFWLSGQNPPGRYMVVVTLRNIDNMILDKKMASFDVIPFEILSGNIYLDPFVVQSKQPVQIKAKTRNAGNIPIDILNLPLSITYRGENSPTLVINRTFTGLAVNEEAFIDYGTFVPEKGGIYDFVITPEMINIKSDLYAVLSVGPYVTGAFSINPTVVSPDDKTVQAKIHLTADTVGLPSSYVPVDHSKVKVMIDTGHAPYFSDASEFGNILKNDEFQVVSYNLRLTKEALKEVNILVLPGTGDIAGGYYTSAEVDAIYDFVINGGGLFVISDHTVIGIPVQPIIQRFGASFCGNNIGSELYISKELIIQHEITENIEAMNQPYSAGCNSFCQLPQEAQILAKYGNYNIIAAIPEGGVAGKGRIVITSDLNMFIYGNSASMINQNPQDPYGIAIKGNSLFTRNAVRWLAPRVPAGIDTTVNLVLPKNNTLSSPYPSPFSVTLLSDNSMEYKWDILNVDTSGIDIEFNLSFKNLMYGKYQVATNAYLNFSNTYTGNNVEVPIDIPTLQVDSFLTAAVSTDKITYSANENVQITTDIKNLMNSSRTGILEVKIIDLNANVVSAVGSQELTLSQNETRTLNYTWNTAQTLSGNYKVYSHFIEAGNITAKAETPITITPVKAVASRVYTDRMAYSSSQPVTITSTIQATSTNYIFTNLTAKIAVSNQQSAQVYTETQTIPMLMPSQLVELKTYWNTATNPKGSYTVKLDVLEGGAAILSTSLATFEILGSKDTGDSLIGTITALPNPVYQGRDETITYTVTNNGNEDIGNLNVRVIIVDPETQAIKIEYSRQNTAGRGETITEVNTVSTATLIPKTYLVILQAVTPTMSEPRTLASTMFEVKPGIEVSKTIPDVANLIVWVNDKCHEKGSRGQGFKLDSLNTEGSHHCSGNDKDEDNGDDEDKDCIRVDLLEMLLKNAVTNYFIVYDKKDFEREMRNPYFTDILILGDHHSLGDHYVEELREKVYSGTGIISSLWLKHGKRHDRDNDKKNIRDTVFGVRHKGRLSGESHLINTLQSPISEEGSIAANGKAERVETLDSAITAGWILKKEEKEEDLEHKHREQGADYNDGEDNQKQQNGDDNQNIAQSPAIVLNQYGNGKAVYYAFDIGLTLNDENYGQLETLIKNSINYIHTPIDTTSFRPNQLIPVEIKLKSFGGAFDLRITETYPSDLKLYDAPTGKWITDNPWVMNLSFNPNETKTLLYYALTPDTSGTYLLQTEVGYVENGIYNFFQNLSAEIIVTKTTSSLTGDIITALNALQLSVHERAKVKNAVRYLQNIQNRGIAAKKDIKQNIHDLLKAIDSLLLVSSTDISGIRLMMDGLLGIFEGNWYFRQ